MKVKAKRDEPAKLKRLTPQQRTLQAHRLAAADFYYAMSPERTAVVMRLTSSQAKSLRKSKPYQSMIDNLQQEMGSTLKRDMKIESERIKQRMAELVPMAIERLHDQLEDNGIVGLQAAREIMDRDGRFPKVSRVQSTIEDKRTMPDVDDALLSEFGVERPVQ